MLVGLPLVEDLVALGRVADGVEHVGVALRVHTFLKRLDGQAEIHLVGGDVLGDVGQVGRLQRVEEYQEGEDLVVRDALGFAQARVVLDVLGEIDFLRNPEVVHGLAVPAGHPGVLHVVEVVEVRGVAADHAAVAHVEVAVGVEEGLFDEGLVVGEGHGIALSGRDGLVCRRVFGLLVYDTKQETVRLC